MKQHALPLTLLVLASACSAPSARIAPRYGTFDVSGDFGIATGAIADVPTSDLETAGITEDDGYFGLKAEVDLGSPVITVSSQLTDHSGSGTLENDLGSGGDLIPGGTAVDNDVSFGLHQVALTFDVVPGDTVDLGLGLGVTLADMSAEMTDGVETITADRELYIPTLALRGRVALGPVEAGAMVSYMAVDLDGDELGFLDYEVEATYHLFGGEDRLGAAIGAGYRVVELELDFEDDGDSVEADFRFSGPYVQLSLSF
jgi:hypothetical protein